MAEHEEVYRLLNHNQRHLPNTLETAKLREAYLELMRWCIEVGILREDGHATEEHFAGPMRRLRELEERISDYDLKDSDSLRELRSAIDEHLGWPSQQDEDGGDYVARVQDVGYGLEKIHEKIREAATGRDLAEIVAFLYGNGKLRKSPKR